MKLSCNQENLQKGINTVNKIIGNRASLPVLNNILISSDNGRLKLSSTDLEIAVKTWIGAKVDEEGSITVPARLLTEFITNNSDEKINFSTKDDILNIKSINHQANIKGINASEFPLIPEFKDAKKIEINSKKLYEGIIHTVFACAHDETRPVLTGLLIKIKQEQLKLVATDSYRLAEATTDIDKKHKDINVIVPARAMSEISRIISQEEMGKVEISFSENQIMFSVENTQIISRLIEGSFPDYEQIIPKNHQTKVKLRADKFSQSIKMASFFARESANNIKIKLIGGKTIEILAVSPQVGDEVSKIQAESFEGKPAEIAFNAKFVLDVLATINEDQIIMEINSSINPVVIKPVKSKNLLYVIMPLRIEE